VYSELRKDAVNVITGHDARDDARVCNLPLYHGKLSLVEPAISNRVKRFSDAKIPDIRGIPQGTRDIFIKSCDIVMSANVIDNLSWISDGKGIPLGIWYILYQSEYL
jgi:hypothetical protein